MRSDVGLYYYFLPNGEIYQYGVGLAGQVATSYYAAPQTLIDQVPLDTPEVQLTIAGGQLTIDPPADYVGTFQVDVSASDGNSTIEDSFTVEVTNTAPTTPAISDQTVISGDLPLTVDLGDTTDVDGDAVTYTVAVNTTAAHAYDVKTQLGLTTYLPQFDNYGGAGLKWMRSNLGLYYYMNTTGEIYQYGAGLVAQMDASYAADPQSLIDQQALATPEVTTTIGNGGPITTCTITPPEGFVGTFQLDVSATDGNSTVNDAFTVTVTNTAPEWENLPGDQSMSYNDDTLVVPFTATDADGDTITYTAETTTPNVTLTIADGQLTIDPPADFVGSIVIDVSAKDGIATLDESFTVTVTNSGPEWENLPGDQTMSHDDDTLVVPFSATDVDGDTITYTAETTTPDVTLTIAGGQLTIDPPAEFVGTIEVDVSATDGNSTLNETFTVTVTNVAPEWENLPGDQSMNYNDDTLVVAFSATDDDGDTLTYTAETTTPNITLTIDNGQLTIDPPADFVGTFQVDVSASDGFQTITGNFNVEVINHAPHSLSIADQSVAPDDLPLVVNLGPTTDDDGDTVTYTVEVDTPGVTTSIDASGEIATCTITPPAEFLGTIQVDVSATDGVNTVTTDFDVLVEETPSIIIVDYWFTETAPGTWDVSLSITGDDTAGLSAYGFWVYADPATITYTENILGTAGDGFAWIGFSPGTASQGDVGGNFNAGNYQFAGTSALLGIGQVAIDEEGALPGTTPHVVLGVPALLGTLTTPEGLTVTDFAADGVGLLDATGDGYLSSPPVPSVHVTPLS